MSSIPKFLKSLCIDDREKAGFFLYDFAGELIGLRLNVKIWRDRALSAEDRMCAEYRDFRNKKRQIKNMLKSMGIKVSPGSPLSKLLRVS